MLGKDSITYVIQYTNAAENFFRKHEDVREEYKVAIKELLTGDHPEKVDVKRISGKKNDYYRIRLGNARVVYAVINRRIVVINIVLADSRGDVYKKMRLECVE